MEKIIKFGTTKTEYIIKVGEKEIKINHESKSLNSQDLYDICFKEYETNTDYKFENDIDKELNEIFEDGEIKEKNKLKAEGNFIWGKISTLIKEICDELNRNE